MMKTDGMKKLTVLLLALLLCILASIDVKAETPASGESALTDAFMSQDDDDEDEDADTSVLNSMAEDDNTAAEVREEDSDYQTLNEQENQQILAEMAANALRDLTFTAKALDLEPLVNAKMEQFTDGVFSWPVPGMILQTGSQAEETPDPSHTIISVHQFQDETKKYGISARILLADSKAYADFPASLESYINQLIPTVRAQNSNIYCEEKIILDGLFPAYLIGTTKTMVSLDGVITQTVNLDVLYVRGCNAVLYLSYSIRSEPGTVFSTASLPTGSQLEPILSRISYKVPKDKTTIPEWLITEDDFVFEVEKSSDRNFITSGNTIKFKGTYTQEDLKKRVSNLTKVAFTVCDPEAIEAGKNMQESAVDKSVAAISSDGTLKAGKTDKPVTLYVIAYSPHTSAKAEKTVITLLPKITKLSLDSNKMTLYQGTSAPLTIRAAAEPDNGIWYSDSGEGNLTWTSSNPEVLQVTDNLDGTATLTALAAGKAKITAKDTLGGKQAAADITVLVPVTEVMIEGPDTAGAGKTVSLKAVLTPEKPGNKKVKWSTDADVSVASIRDNGSLLIKKGVPSGTVITVWCEAEGAETPVKASRTITVE